MQPTKFDELTKALASATSRRHALRTIVTASIGSFFGLGGIRSVFGAVSGSNTNCAKWCAQVFGPNTSAASKCTSDAAHNKGPCKQCPSTPPSSICCVRNSHGYCSSYTGANCCASNQICHNGVCGPCFMAGNNCSTSTDCCSHNCCNDVCCDSTQTCVGGTCCSSNQICNGVCCPAGQMCVSGSCCPTVRACGSVCLPTPCDSSQCL